MLMRQTFRLSAVALVILALGFATVASAQVTYQMSGEWYMNRGPLIDIPAQGGAGVCLGGAGTGCMGQLKPANGGIPGMAHIAVAPASGAFVVPPHAFGFNANHTKTVAAVAIIPTVVQLSSTWALQGPPTPAETPAVPAVNIPGSFMKSAWLLDPGQGPRLQKSFTWCNFTASTLPQNCTNSKNGPYTGIVTYKNPNPNAFGGTMAMMIAGNGVVSVLAPVSPYVGHQIVGAGMPGNPQHPGRGYKTFDTDMLVGGPVHFGFMTNPPCSMSLPPAPVGCGVITSSGPVVGAMPADSNWNWGFPWTTGTVTVQNVQTGGTSTLTGMGTDTRSLAGAGKITLVAGGATRRKGAAQDFAALDIVNMTFAPMLPSMSRPGLVAGAVLMLLAVGYAYRRRL